MNAKEFAEFARRTAHPNIISWGGKLNLWLPDPASVAEWEAKSIRVHQEQERLNEEDRAREAGKRPRQVQPGSATVEFFSFERS